MTIDVRPERKADGASAGPSRDKRRQSMILVGIGLGLLIRLLRDPRFYTYAITLIIVLVTGGKAARENQARSIERLVEWNKRQTKRLEHTVKDAAHDVKDALPG